MRVEDLSPGDLVMVEEDSQEVGVFVARTVHPLWPHLQLVVWRMRSRDGKERWSHDALDPRQEVGHVLLSTVARRRERLQWAFAFVEWQDEWRELSHMVEHPTSVSAVLRRWSGQSATVVVSTSEGGQALDGPRVDGQS